MFHNIGRNLSPARTSGNHKVPHREEFANAPADVPQIIDFQQLETHPNGKQVFP
jgi:hypothetical protein